MSLATNVVNLATRVATEVKSIRTLINGNTVGLPGLTTSTKTNLVAAINEVQAAVVAAAANAGAKINDATASATTTYSGSKIEQLVSAATAALVASAPTTLDTLDELAAALGDDANFAASTATALGNRVRFDAAQTLTTAQALQARTNTGSAAAADVGDPATNFVTTFESGLT